MSDLERFNEMFPIELKPRDFFTKEPMQDLHPMGCARLVQAAVKEALWPRYAGGKNIPDANDLPGHLLRQRADGLVRFMDSTIVEHYAAAMAWDLEKVKEGIARRAAEWYAKADHEDERLDEIINRIF